jgi:tetratricopeptide (TPR) repeat protein
MSEIHASSLTPRQQTLYAKARYALESGNLEYVLQACAELLRDAPGCLSVRQLQRLAQLRRHETAIRITAKMNGWICAVRHLVGLAGGDPARTFAAAEAILERDPASTFALRKLGESARAAGMLDIAIFAFQQLWACAPDEVAAPLLLASTFLAAGRSADALRIANQVLKRQPANPGAVKIARDASIAVTISRGNWAAALAERQTRDEPAQLS